MATVGAKSLIKKCHFRHGTLTQYREPESAVLVQCSAILGGYLQHISERVRTTSNQFRFSYRQNSFSELKLEIFHETLSTGTLRDAYLEMRISVAALVL